MTTETAHKILAILQAMPSTQGWSDFHSEMYVTIMRGWQDDFAQAVIAKIFMSEEWRPAPAKLLKVAAQLASPLPDEESAYAEIMERARFQGLYARPSGRSTLFLAGPPETSHPILQEVIACCGGWEMICSGEANMQEGLRKQIRSSYANIAERWTAMVAQQLSIPTTQRDTRYFPVFKPYQLFGTVTTALPAAPDTLQITAAESELTNAR